MIDWEKALSPSIGTFAAHAASFSNLSGRLQETQQFVTDVRVYLDIDDESHLVCTPLVLALPAFMHACIQGDFWYTPVHPCLGCPQ